jgi:hypothetical protein
MYIPKIFLVETHEEKVYCKTDTVKMRKKMDRLLAENARCAPAMKM